MIAIKCLHFIINRLHALVNGVLVFVSDQIIGTFIQLRWVYLGEYCKKEISISKLLSHGKDTIEHLLLLEITDSLFWFILGVSIDEKF